jgi:hypothetical protein
LPRGGRKVNKNNNMNGRSYFAMQRFLCAGESRHMSRYEKTTRQVPHPNHPVHATKFPCL